MDHRGPQDDAFAESLAREALETLRHHWGDAYDIVRSDGAWWAARRDGLGSVIKAMRPDDLGTAISRDYSARPVPRGDHPYPEVLE